MSRESLAHTNVSSAFQFVVLPSCSSEKYANLCCIVPNILHYLTYYFLSMIIFLDFILLIISKSVSLSLVTTFLYAMKFASLLLSCFLIFLGT
uniref:Uncharacterized protein n=1 Tax=Rhizophora mucronata TaxID=61149 RepID=A0A2P2P021_RHIMU